MSKIVGLVPAAGRATRISPLPFSKEIIPIGFYDSIVNGQARPQPKPVSRYLLERMALAQAEKVYFVISPDKVDIPRCYGDGSDVGMPIAYLVIENSRGMPYTLDQARPWLTDETVIFGMPDTIFQPVDAFVRLLEKHQTQKSDLTLGLFPTDQPQRFTSVHMDNNDHVLSVVDKPASTKTNEIVYTWGIACWSSRFTKYMGVSLQKAPLPAKEVVLSEVFQSAIDQKLTVLGLRFDGGEYIDVGTPEDLAMAIKRFN